ncbi:hypothetical protein AVEN_25461-1 [Araneus ventricosus]|uniref:Uncharacterized protein n=1 Tax=Araneus ventricosus TaxID=182803 RepID=A0A4Y2N6E3_ARAVE|nr:hypothetical protein AVEN_25461-1 [Araneus ventricosus]
MSSRAVAGRRRQLTSLLCGFASFSMDRPDNRGLRISPCPDVRVSTALAEISSDIGTLDQFREQCFVMESLDPLQSCHLLRLPRAPTGADGVLHLREETPRILAQNMDISLPRISHLLLRRCSGGFFAVRIANTKAGEAHQEQIFILKHLFVSSFKQCVF